MADELVRRTTDYFFSQLLLTISLEIVVQLVIVQLVGLKTKPNLNYFFRNSQQQWGVTDI